MGSAYHPHVQPGWRFLTPAGSVLREDGWFGEITERGVDGHPDLVRARAIHPDGTTRMFGGGRVFHVSVFARWEPKQ